MTTTLHLLVILLIFCIIPLVHAEEKSKAQLEWESLIGARALKDPAFAYVEDDPNLPRVLLIGDSISIGYTKYVREMLAGKANLHRIPENGGNTQRGIDNLDAWLRGETWDVIHVNWGLHDIKRLRGGKLDASADRAIDPEQYRNNLTQLITRLKATKAEIVWCITTPVPEGSAGRIPGDEALYNTIAREVMTKHHVPINDLHGYIEPDLDTYQLKANVHFTREGSEHLAIHVTKHINKALATKDKS